MAVRRWLLFCGSLAALLAAQTRVSGPRQVRDFAPMTGGYVYAQGLPAQNISGGSCIEFAFPAPGASFGQPVMPGWPPNLPDRTVGVMRAGLDNVLVRVCNVGSQPVTVPASTFTAALWR